MFVRQEQLAHNANDISKRDNTSSRGRERRTKRFDEIFLKTHAFHPLCMEYCIAQMLAAAYYGGADPSGPIFKRLCRTNPAEFER